jgi:hypothetical protein
MSVHPDHAPIRNPVVQVVFRADVALIVAPAFGTAAYQALARPGRCAVHPACASQG